MNDHDPIERVLFVAKSKSDLHRAIDALPEDAKLILVADACCCGDPEHATQEALYTAAFGEPSLVQVVGLLRLAEHRVIGEALTDLIAS